MPENLKKTVYESFGQKLKPFQNSTSDRKVSLSALDFASPATF